jgi:para-aminobenzoate synthetase/4-amino-4-deoxychorismate lyase
MRVAEGHVADLAEHLGRLEASTVDLYGKRLPERLRADLAACLAAHPSGRLRLTARPVGGPLQVTIEVVGLSSPGGATPRTPRCEPDRKERDPIGLASPSGAAPRVRQLMEELRPVVVPGGLGQHKWKDRRLLADLAARAGLGPEFMAAGEHLLLIDVNGDVLETDRGSIFVVIDGVLMTPPLDGRLLPGVTRAAALRLAAEDGVPVKEAPLTVDAVLHADEVLVTNSVAGVVPLRRGRVGEWLAGALAGRPVQGAEVPARMAGSRTALTQISARPLVVLVDNYDSFTYNLAHLLSGAGCAVEVVRNDEVPAEAVAALRPDGIVISPGPCAPAGAGISVDVVRRCGQDTPLLGICLGHQAIAVAYGGRVIQALAPAHGHASVVSHDGKGVLAGLPEDFWAARYHSLIVDDSTLPPDLRVTARLISRGDVGFADHGIVMGIRHASHPVEGLQFHPESILTVPHGRTIIGNFLHAARLAGEIREAG